MAAWGVSLRQQVASPEPMTRSFGLLIALSIAAVIWLFGPPLPILLEVVSRGQLVKFFGVGVSFLAVSVLLLLAAIGFGGRLLIAVMGGLLGIELLLILIFYYGWFF